MPFRGLIRARRVVVIGSNGQMIIIDEHNGLASIRLFSGDPDEVSPAVIENLFGTGLRITSPENSSNPLPPSSIVMGQEGIDVGENNGVHRFGASPNSHFEVDPLGDNTFKSLTGENKFTQGGVRVEEGLGFTDSGTLIGNACRGIAGDSVQNVPANASGGRVVTHGLGEHPTVYGAFTQEGNSTFRAVNDDANTDASTAQFIFRNTQNNAVMAAGNNVSFRWFALLL